MRLLKLIIGIAVAFGYIATAEALEIRVVPADSIILNSTNPDKGYRDIVVHTVAVATGLAERATIISLRLEILSQGRMVLAQDIFPDEMAEETAQLAGAPIQEFVNGQLLEAGGQDALFRRQLTFASSAALEPSQLLLAMRLHFSLAFEPDELRATATFTDLNGRQTASTSIPVRPHTSKIIYHSPLKGQWLMQAIPGVQSHHRFNPSTEFAVDLFKLGPDGHVAHGDPVDPRNFYGYGAPILAAADGTVVVVIADQVQDRKALVRTPGEAVEHWNQRVDDFHLAQMRKNFRVANAGNLITLRHENGGAVEYSSYGHLKTGSILVKQGDHVKQGQPIAEVGDTGDSAEVHLHFQVNSGADAFTSKSLPFAFADFSGVDGNSEMGVLMSTANNPLRY